MRRSIKITLVIILLACLYFFLPFFFGVMTQHYTTQFLNNENKTLGKVLGVRLSFAQYHRGWFHSDAVLQVEKENSVGDWKSFQSIPIVIEHGPSFDVDHHRMIGVGMISAKSVSLWENSPYKVNVEELIRFNGERGTAVFFDDKSNSTVAGFKVASLIMTVHSDLKADNFFFKIAGKGLHFDDPQQSLSLTADDFNLGLTARYLDDRHWKMIVGLLSNNDTISMSTANGAISDVAIHANSFKLDQLHFDTKEMAKLLGELVQIKQASDEARPVSPSAWMAFFQQLLVQMVHNDTNISLQGLSIKTPMGDLQLHYDISFPALPVSHDYFDIATNGVGKLKLVVPHWNYLITAQNRHLSLSDFQYVENNNTVFSRHSNLSFGAFDIADSAAQSQAPLFYVTGFSYDGNLQGSVDTLSQLMNWKVVKLCLSGQCFNKLNGELKLMNMNYGAFRNIAVATQQLVQFDSSTAGSVESKWNELANAYVNLISSNTRVDFSHEMQTPRGVMTLHASVSWPGLRKKAAEPNLLSTVMDRSVYQLRLQFPSVYVDEFLNERTGTDRVPTPKAIAAPLDKPVEPTFEAQVIDFLKYAISQGYLKKTGDAYQADLLGKGAVFTINGIVWKSPAAS